MLKEGRLSRVDLREKLHEERRSEVVVWKNARWNKTRKEGKREDSSKEVFTGERAAVYAEDDAHN